MHSYRKSVVFLKYIVAICLLHIALMACAQYPQYVAYNDENGLPSNQVYSIVQDKQGFIWIGCDAGLYRYNGVRYIAYENTAQKSRPVSGLCISGNGTLYCYNFQGQIFYTTGDSLVNLKHGYSHISNITADGNNNLYVNHIGGIAVYNSSTHSWKNYENFGIDNPYGYKLYTKSARCNTKNEVYFLSTSGIGVITANALRVIPYGASVVRPPGEFILELYGHEAWMISSNGDLVCSSKSGAMEKVDNPALYAVLQNRKVTNARTLADGWLWICTYKGLVRYNRVTGVAQLLYPDIAFSDCMLDREGNYWLTTLQSGIMRVPDLNYAVWNTQSGLPNEKLTKVTVAGSRVCFATVNGYTGSVDTATGKLTLYPTVSNADVQCLDYIPQDNATYFFTKGTIYAIAGDKVKPVQYEVPPVKGLTKAGNTYLLASSFGIHSHNFATAAKATPLTGVWAREIAYDEIWNKAVAVTDSGFVILGLQNDVWKTSHLVIPGTQLLSQAYDTAAQAWLVLSHKGDVYRIDTNYRYRLLATLPRGITAYRLKYSNRRLVVATNKGLYIYHTATGNHILITPADGLASASVQDVCIAGHTIWLATGKGLQCIPAEQYSTPVRPLVYIKQLYAGTTPVLSHSNIDLTYNQALHIWPEASAYSSGSSFKYAYRIGNSEWTYLPGNIEQITIPNLPSGALQLQLKVVDHTGLDSEDMVVLTGYVHPPFWKTTWFFILVLVMALAMAWLLFSMRIKALRRKQQLEIERLNMENELQQMHQTALKAQMNPHFIFNVLNSIKGYIYDNDKAAAAEYLSKFAQLIRKILEASNQPAIKLADELEVLELYIQLEAMQLDGPFSYSIQVSDAIDTESIAIPALLIQPIAENAFKHGLRHLAGPKELKLSLTLATGNLLKIEVADNGIGLDKAAAQNKATYGQHVSFATGATHKRLALINKQKTDTVNISLTDNPGGQGTLVTMYIQL